MKYFFKENWLFILVMTIVPYASVAFIMVDVFWAFHSMPLRICLLLWIFFVIAMKAIDYYVED